MPCMAGPTEAGGEFAFDFMRAWLFKPEMWAKEALIKLRIGTTPSALPSEVGDIQGGLTPCSVNP